LVEPGFYELDRGEPAMCAVRPVHVVVDSPVVEKHPGFEDGLEGLAVAEFVTESPVERFDPGVLPRRSRVDEDVEGAVPVSL
jgi:hypothetical protein